MCGIAGIINQRENIIDEGQLRKMTRSAAHRGPDGEGFYIDGKIGFGHRRLSIIDLTDGGHQPMYLDNSYVITFNGEIYNYIEIRNELKKLGHSFSTQSDTEVILKAYKQWGESCVNHFNGMWAFAIHDKIKEIVFCSRDRFGVKPFYYTVLDGKFMFASEIKQFTSLTSGWKINRKIMMDYLVFNLIDHNHECFFQDIFKLPGSHNLIYDLSSDRIKINKYYSLSIHKNIAALSEADTIALFQEQFNRSIEWRLRSDVKVGTCLSGGLDSSYIAALASSKYENGLEKFSAVTARSIDEKQDESAFAKIVVDACDLNWLVTTPTTDDFISTLDRVIYNQDEPFISPSVYMQHFVMKKARENGITVLLDGQGADEVMLGYQKYLGAYFKSLPKSQLITNILRAKDHFGASAFSILKFYYYFTSFSVRYKRNIWKFNDISSKYIELIDPSAIKAIADSYKDIENMQRLEIFSTQLPSLLRFEDKNSMANSIESRLPFLDWNFVETALSINNQFKIKSGWSKYILRKSMDSLLPPKIAWRKKKFGFNAPTTVWLNQFPDADKYIHRSAVLAEVFGGRIPSYDDEQVKWRLINIARWEHLHHMRLE